MAVPAPEDTPFCHLPLFFRYHCGDTQHIHHQTIRMRVFVKIVFSVHHMCICVQFNLGQLKWTHEVTSSASFDADVKGTDVLCYPENATEMR